MAKFVIFSDLHLHPFPQFSSINNEGLNTRLLEIADVLSSVLDAAVASKCDAVLFAGDFFHTRMIAAETLDLASRTLRNYDIPIVMIPGNHDQSVKLGEYHSSRVLGSENITILDSYDGYEVEIAGKRIIGTPYGSTINKDSKADIMLLHLGIKGARMGADFIDCRSEHDANALLGLAGIVFCGHYHNPALYHKDFEYSPEGETCNTFEEYNTLIIPGAPIHHNFGDCGSRRGYWVLDYDAGFINFYPNKYKEFVKIESSKATADMLKNRYVCLLKDSELDPSLLKVNRNILIRDVVNKVDERVDMRDMTDYRELLKEYIKTKKVTDEKVYDYGVMLMDMAKTYNGFQTNKNK